jgi:hypothetical protein
MLFKLHLRGSESSWHTMDGTEEPDESITHVRVCGGAGWVTTGSTRKRTGPPLMVSEVVRSAKRPGR